MENWMAVRLLASIRVDFVTLTMEAEARIFL